MLGRRPTATTTTPPSPATRPSGPLAGRARRSGGGLRRRGLRRRGRRRRSPRTLVPRRIVTPRARRARSSSPGQAERHPGEELVGELDDRDVGAELGEGAAQLDADVAAADHGEPVGDPAEGEGGGGVEDPLPVEGQAAAARRGGTRWPGPRSRTRRRRRRRPGSTATRRAVAKRAVPVATRHAGVAQQLLDAAGEAADDVADPGLGPVEVDRRREVDADAPPPRRAGRRCRPRGSAPWTGCSRR